MEGRLAYLSQLNMKTTQASTTPVAEPDDHAGSLNAAPHQ